MKRIRLVSSDLNGTLVHPHTMLEMIRVGFPDRSGRYAKAKEAFSRQTRGRLSMERAFEIAGPLTKGLSLVQAVDYAVKEMRYVNGFHEFIKRLRDRGIPFVINSTGYSVTIEAMRQTLGPEMIHGAICNRLVFGYDGDPKRPLSEAELFDHVRKIIRGGSEAGGADQIRATGEVILGIRDEGQKAHLIFGLARKMGIEPHEIAHIGDTMGDSRGICETARNGGLGIAFNYNEALKNHLERFIAAEPDLPGRIVRVDPKGADSDLIRVLNLLIPK